jgi:hypothetical protein
MSFGSEYDGSVHEIERVVVLKQEIQVLCCFAQEETLHAVPLLATDNIA